MSATEITLSSSDYIAISSAFIAFLALGLTIFEGMAARKHNKLSVLPHLMFHSNVKSPSEEFKLELFNNGLGPAFISKFIYKFNGRKYDFMNENRYDELMQLICEGIVDPNMGWYNRDYTEGESIAVGERVTLMRIDSILPDISRDRIIELEIEIHYKCVYGISYKLSLKKSQENLKSSI